MPMWLCCRRKNYYFGKDRHKLEVSLILICLASKYHYLLDEIPPGGWRLDPQTSAVQRLPSVASMTQCHTKNGGRGTLLRDLVFEAAMTLVLSAFYLIITWNTCSERVGLLAATMRGCDGSLLTWYKWLRFELDCQHKH
ncbi:hypothetical protein Ancab_013598 [Ancistrocladus abbreviatus]